jgi:hypothetical protein
MDYDSPCLDPWFSATQKLTAPGVAPYYEADQWSSTLGCLDQHQICLDPSRAGTCTVFNGSLTLPLQLEGMDLSDTQIAIYTRLDTALQFSSLFNSVNGRGPAALLASQTVYDQFGQISQTSLPIDQWTKEVSSWFALQMALLQRGVVEYATGPSNLADDGHVVPPVTEASRKLCSQQKVPLANGYQNFSLAGVIAILAVGGFVILVGLLIDVVLVAIQKRWFCDSYGWLAWTLDEKLQVQRLAQQNAGWGGYWIGELDGVPVTRDRELLGNYEGAGLEKKASRPAMVERWDSGMGERVMSGAEEGRRYDGVVGVSCERC